MAPVVTHNLLRVAASKRPSAQYGKTGEGQSVGNGGGEGVFVRTRRRTEVTTTIISQSSL